MAPLTYREEPRRLEREPLRYCNGDKKVTFERSWRGDIYETIQLWGARFKHSHHSFQS